MFLLRTPGPRSPHPPHRVLGRAIAPLALIGMLVSALFLRGRPSQAGPPPAAVVIEATAPAPEPTAPTDVRDAIGRALDFAVTIEDNGVYGAGVLLSPAAGLVVTAQHVIDEMHTPRVQLYDGHAYTAKVLDTDRVLDLALLQIPPQKGAPPVVGDATRLRPGEEVYAIGCPRHLAFTVSRGIVSYVGRWMDGARYVQTDLPINDGNSGGPVVNQRGELVGIMSFILRRAQGLSFALPANYAIARFRALKAPVNDPNYVARFRAWSGFGAPSTATAATDAHGAPVERDHQ